MKLDFITHTIIPAQPGWFVVIFTESMNERIDEYPIIAWDIKLPEDQEPFKYGKIHFQHQGMPYAVTPLTVDNNILDIDQKAIKRPDQE